jgi:hypothetical protein
VLAKPFGGMAADLASYKRMCLFQSSYLLHSMSALHVVGLHVFTAYDERASFKREAVVFWGLVSRS